MSSGETVEYYDSLVFDPGSRLEAGEIPTRYAYVRAYRSGGRVARAEVWHGGAAREVVYFGPGPGPGEHGERYPGVGFRVEGDPATTAEGEEREVRRYGADGALTGVDRILSDRDGDRLREDRFDAAGLPLGSVVYRYGAGKRLERCLEYDGSGRLVDDHVVEDDGEE